MNRAVILLVVAFVPMLFEARRSRRHERALRGAGAIEPAGDVYPVMRVAYPACFSAMAGEAWLRDAPYGRSFAAGAMLFAAAKAVKYWAIVSLGPRWTFRVLVPPDTSRITSGPYRWMRHPNYLGVAGELAGAALLAGAPVTGLLSCLLFGGVLLARIRVEERALGPVDR
jgi:methyltransferase